MAIYHLSTKPVSRSSGRSATASAAYRAGVDITDDRTGIDHQYSKRNGVVDTEIVTPNKIEISRSDLWNMAEATETRKNSRTAREIVVNLPYELDQKTRGDAVKDFAAHLSDKYGVAVDVAIHKPDQHGDNRNHHAHLLLTTRKIERLESGRIALTSKSQLELSNTQLKDLGLPRAQDELKAVRKTWAEITNKYLERDGIAARIDHRSHADRGLIQLPTKKLGWEASALERNGIRTSTGDYNRQVKADNERIERLQSQIVVGHKLLAKQQLEKKAQEARKRPNEPVKADKAPTAAPNVAKRAEQSNKRPNVDGQTINQANKVIEGYEKAVSSVAKEIQDNIANHYKTEMARLTVERETLEDNKSWFGKGKREEQIDALKAQYNEENKKHKLVYQSDFIDQAYEYVKKNTPHIISEAREASTTLEAHALFKQDAIDARRKTHYSGEITAVSRLGILQKTFEGKTIYHDLEKLQALPNVGDKVKISYDRKLNASLEPTDKAEWQQQQQQEKQLEQQRELYKGLER